MRALALLTLIAACDLPAPARSGFRVRAQYLRGGDNSTFLRFFDNLAGRPCIVATATDGEARCVPLGTVVEWAYLDDACTDAVAVVPCETTPSEFFTLTDARGTGYYAALELPAPPAIFRSSLENGCQLDPTFVPETDRVYGLGEAPPELFMKGAWRTVEVGSKLSRRTFYGDDGAVAAADVVDKRGNVLKPQGAGRGRGARVYWTAQTVASFTPRVFADDACTAPVIAAPAGPPSAVLYVETLRSADSCDVTPQRLFTAGGVASTLFQTNAGECAPLADPSAAPNPFVATPVDPSTVTWGHVGSRGVGRLMRSFVASDDSSLVDLDDGRGLAFAPPLFDRDLLAPCRYAETSAGWRCLPESPSPVVYRDAECTQPAAKSSGIDDQDARCNKPGVVSDGRTHYRVGQELGVAQVYERAPATEPSCHVRPKAPCTPAGTALLYDVTPLALEDFAKGSIE